MRRLVRQATVCPVRNHSYCNLEITFRWLFSKYVEDKDIYFTIEELQMFLSVMHIVQMLKVEML